MIRIILVALLVILFLILSIPVLIAEWIVGKISQQAKDRQSLAIIRWIFKIILKLSGVRVTVNGLENIPKDEAVLYVGNHRSYFDILVGYTTVPAPMGFVAKKEMLAYPLLRDWMKNVRCLFLDRENMKEGLKTILKGIEQVKSGVSVWIFPEGTRNRSQALTELLPFKEGSLKIAEKTGCMIVPVAIRGSAEVFEAHLPMIRPSHITITYGVPYRISDLSGDNRKFAGAYTRDMIIHMLKKEID